MTGTGECRRIFARVGAEEQPRHQAGGRRARSPAPRRAPRAACPPRRAQLRAGGDHALGGLGQRAGLAASSAMASSCIALGLVRPTPPARRPRTWWPPRAGTSSGRAPRRSRPAARRRRRGRSPRCGRGYGATPRRPGTRRSPGPPGRARWPGSHGSPPPRAPVRSAAAGGRRAEDDPAVAAVVAGADDDHARAGPLGRSAASARAPNGPRPSVAVGAQVGTVVGQKRLGRPRPRRGRAAATRPRTPGRCARRPGSATRSARR